MTEQQRIDFEAQGYLCLNINSDNLASLLTAYDQSQNHLDDLPNQDDIFIHLAEHPDIFPSLHRILSDQIQLRSMTGFTLSPNSPSRGWHKEVAGLLGVQHDLSTVCVQVFIHLDDGPEDGAHLMAVPGSHRFKSDLPFPDITYIEEMPHAIKLPSTAGTVAILHGNLWQARTRNQSNAHQRFLNLTYTQCWMRPALPELSLQTLETISASPNLSQLFALRDVSNASGYWHGNFEGYSESSGLPERKFAELTVVGKGHISNTRRAER